MNIAQVLIHCLQHYGADIQLIQDGGIRLYRSEAMPQPILDRIQKYKPQLVRQLQYKASHELLQNIRLDGAEIELIHPDTLRLHHTENLPNSTIQKIKQFKAEIIDILTSQTHTASQQRAPLCPDLLHEAIQTYFDRLEQYRSNLRQKNHSPNNAMVKPNRFIRDLMNRFILHPDQAQQLMNSMIEQRILTYDSNSKLYIFANAQHPAIQVFQHTTQTNLTTT